MDLEKFLNELETELLIKYQDCINGDISPSGIILAVINAINAARGKAEVEVDQCR